HFHWPRLKELSVVTSPASPLLTSGCSGEAQVFPFRCRSISTTATSPKASVSVPRPRLLKLPRFSTASLLRPANLVARGLNRGSNDQKAQQLHAANPAITFCFHAEPLLVPGR